MTRPTSKQLIDALFAIVAKHRNWTVTTSSVVKQIDRIIVEERKENQRLRKLLQMTSVRSRTRTISEDFFRKEKSERCTVQVLHNCSDCGCAIENGIHPPDPNCTLYKAGVFDPDFLKGKR